VQRSQEEFVAVVGTATATKAVCLPYVTRRSSQTKEIKSNASSPSALQNSNPSYHCRRAREVHLCAPSSLFTTTSSTQTLRATSTMGLIKGGFLRLVQTLLYALCFCCAGITLGMRQIVATRQKKQLTSHQASTLTSLLYKPIATGASPDGKRLLRASLASLLCTPSLP